MADSRKSTHLVYGECIICGAEDTMSLDDDQKDRYDKLRSDDADLQRYVFVFPEFTYAQCAFLWAGLCPKHSSGDDR